MQTLLKDQITRIRLYIYIFLVIKQHWEIERNITKIFN